mgnify:CR=1 FL=1
MPIPVSLTEKFITFYSLMNRARMVIDPPEGVYLNALLIKLINTYIILLGSLDILSGIISSIIKFNFKFLIFSSMENNF